MSSLLLGTAAIQQAYLQPNIDSRIQIMKEASNYFGQGRDLLFLKTMTDEQVELIDIQKTLEIRSHRDFVDLSLSETIYNIILLGIIILSLLSSMSLSLTLSLSLLILSLNHY